MKDFYKRVLLPCLLSTWFKLFPGQIWAKDVALCDLITILNTKSELSVTYMPFTVEGFRPKFDHIFFTVQKALKMNFTGVRGGGCVKLTPDTSYALLSPKLLSQGVFLFAENWFSGALFTLREKILGTLKRFSLLLQPKQDFKS